MISSHRSPSPKALGPPTPALANTPTSGWRSNAASRPDNHDCNDWASETSMDTITWAPPSGKDVNTLRNGSSRRPINTKRMPLRWANVRAVAAPMPLPAPVINIEFMISKKQKGPACAGPFLFQVTQISKSDRMLSRIRASQP